jgi:amidohydrolase
MTMVDLLAEAQELFEFSQSLRRDFHLHPELGFQELRTSGVVMRELSGLGLEVTGGVARTGVIALIEGAKPGPVVMLRFDMDALPILEENETEYASRTPGVMHACGHDAHTAIGLTVARLLNARRSELCGTVKLVFQPAEEGLGGAETLIEEGVLDHPKPDVALGLHVWNDKPVGWLGITAGAAMASSDIFQVKITGKGGHGAIPNLAVDPVLAAAQIITALQSIVSRNVSPVQTAVVSVTAVQGGEAFNVIPQTVELKGTLRTFDPGVRQVVGKRFAEIVTQTAAAMGCQADIQLQMLTPALVNDPDVSARVQQTARTLWPEDTIEREYKTMGAEDMAFFLEKIPGCFVFIGSANHELGLDAPHHHPRFDIDERVLTRGAALLTAVTLDFLSGSV